MRPALFSTALICVALVFTDSSFAQNQVQPAKLTGTVADASGAAVARATIVLSTPEGRTEAITTTTGTGTYTISGLRAGTYVLQVFAVGFGASRLTMAQIEAGKDLKQDLKMDIGFVQDTAAAATPSAAATMAEGVTLSRSTPPDPNRLRVGANVMAENLTRKTEPVYPPLAREARIQGVVILEVVIGNDGVPKGIHVISGHPLLQIAAIETVKDWRYKPVLQNGSSVEVVTTVNVAFTAAP